jgi:hypothetical protein
MRLGLGARNRFDNIHSYRCRDAGACRMASCRSTCLFSEFCVGLEGTDVKTLGVGLPGSCCMSSRGSSLLYLESCVGVKNIGVATVFAGLPMSCMASRASFGILCRSRDARRRPKAQVTLVQAKSTNYCCKCPLPLVIHFAHSVKFYSSGRTLTILYCGKRRNESNLIFTRYFHLRN